MRTAGLLGFVAGLAVALPGAARAAVITDPAGDANGLATAGLSLTTAPASDATRDLTRVSVERDLTGLTVRFTLSAPPQLDGPVTFAILRGRRGACNVSLAVAWGNLEGAAGDAPIAVSDLDDCREEFFGIGHPGYTATLEGSTLVARYSYDALGANRMGVGPRTPVSALRAETLVGTFGSSGGFTSCSPEPCEPQGLRYSKSGFHGAVVDATDGGPALSALRTSRRSSSRAARP